MKTKIFILLCVLLGTSLSFSQSGGGERVGGKGGNGHDTSRFVKEILKFGYSYSEKDCKLATETRLLEKVCNDLLALSVRGVGQEEFLFECCVGHSSGGANAEEK